MNIEMSRSDKLKLLLKIKGIQMADVAAAAGTSVSYVSCELRKGQHARSKVVEAACQLADIELAELSEPWILETASEPPRRRPGKKCVPPHVNADLRHYLRRNGITVAMLQRKMGVAVGSMPLYRTVNGTCRISRDMYVDICKALEVPLETFCDFYNPKEEYIDE